MLLLAVPALAASPCARLPGGGPDDFGEGPSPRAKCTTARVLGMGGAGLAVAGAGALTAGILLNEADPSGNQDVAWPLIFAGGGGVALGTPLMIAGAASMADLQREHGHRVVKWPTAVAWATCGASMLGFLAAVPTQGASLPEAAVAFGGAIGFGAAQWAIDTRAWKDDGVEVLFLPNGVAGTF